MAVKKTFDQLRAEYLRASFDEDEAREDPFEQFMRWFDDAADEGLPLANACALATVSAEGQPSVRVVLLKNMGPDGFVFFTNYDSRKGRELIGNPRASLLFWWPPLERQIRIEGSCARVSSEESDEYFRQRPRASNLSAMASAQSEVVPDRSTLEAQVRALDEKWYGHELERPENWGGFRLWPEAFEFWQGRADRLHDRLRYRRSGERWVRERLCP